MTPEQAVNLAAGLGALAAAGVFIALVYGPWQTHCVEWARDRLFKERDNIFDLAVKGKLCFESPEYREIRAQINTLIRYAHWTRLWRVALLGPLVRSAIRDGEWAGRPNLFEVCDRIQDLQTAQLVKEHIWRVHLALRTLTIMRSPLMWLIAPLALALGLIPERLRNEGFLRALQQEANGEQMAERRLHAIT